jgi:hypothetical protein
MRDLNNWLEDAASNPLGFAAGPLEHDPDP